MNILLAEDDIFFQTFYSKKLSEKGFSVTIAKDGEEAIAILQKTIPDMLLLDLIMPKKDGFEVLSEIRKNEQLKSLPILVFSTLGQEKDLEKAKSLGATDFVNKTFFDFEVLLSKITNLIKKAQTSS